MNEFKVYLRGRDSAQAPALIDWRKHYYNLIVPTFRRQPAIALQIVGQAIPLEWDGTTEAELYLDDDVNDPGYDNEPKHNDDELSGAPTRVPTPQIFKTLKLKTDQENRAYIQQDRFANWTKKSIGKIKEFEDKKAFQGDTTLGVNGFVGSDSTDLGAPTGVWDVDTGNNGILNNALDDLIALKSNFTNKGFYGRPIHVGLTSYAYDLLESTPLVQRPLNNLQLWYETLPKGSQIYVSNNIQASVTANANTMVGLVDLGIDPTTEINEQGAYAVYSSGIQQGVHQTDIWEKRYGLREKFTVKVADDDYVCYMDAIDTTT
jgi:hypothetical protein